MGRHKFTKADGLKGQRVNRRQGTAVYDPEIQALAVEAARTPEASARRLASAKKSGRGIIYDLKLRGIGMHYRYHVYRGMVNPKCRHCQEAKGYKGSL